MKKRIAIGAPLAAVAVLVALTLAACTSGSGPGTVKAYSSGAITAKGSIFVNGVEFDTSTAAITINDLAVTEAFLKVGMDVEVKGDIDLATQTGTASQVKYTSSLEGPISAIAAPNMTVLGQTVKVDSGTHFELPLTGIGDLAVADIIEVAAYPDGSGTLVATFIEKKPSGPGAGYEIDGAVSGIAGRTNSSFTLNPLGGTPLTVNFSDTLDAGISEGMVVVVEFNTFSGTTITAGAGNIHLKQVLSPDEGDYVELEGYVTNLVPPHFNVNMIPVDAGSLSLAGIANGSKVEVKGTYSGGNFLLSSIEVK